MALSPAPHRPPQFRVLKQAWRDYLVTGGGMTVTISTPAAQVIAAATTVSGIVTADVSVPTPVGVRVQLVQGTVVKAVQTIPADKLTGAYTVTFPASTLAAGPAIAQTTTTMVQALVSSGSFTVT